MLRTLGGIAVLGSVALAAGASAQEAETASGVDAGVYVIQVPKGGDGISKDLEAYLKGANALKIDPNLVGMQTNETILQTPGFNDGGGYHPPFPGGGVQVSATTLSDSEINEVIALCKAALNPANYAICKRFKVGTAP
jgi:hypothetical protein